MATLLEKELNSHVFIIGNGKRRKISKLRAAIKQFVNKAAGGDMKAVQQLINISRELSDATMLKKLPTEITIDVFDQNSDEPLYQSTNYVKWRWYF